MNILGFQITKAKAQLKASDDTARDSATPGGDVFADQQKAMDGSIFKGYIPTFLYKPPFGYPRSENIPLIKAMAKNPYIHAVVTTLQEEAAWNKWEIVPKKSKLPKSKSKVKPLENKDPSVKADPSGDELPSNNSALEKCEKIANFLNNPNENPQGFSHLIKCAVRDICETDSGAWVKIFNKKKEFTQLTVLDGASILKNPDIHGNIGSRAEIVFPTDVKKIDSFGQEEQIKYYNLYYKDQAAYFQYGWTVASLPVPFGKRELVYFMKNPRSDSIYGTSPVMILTDILLTLVYGARYNLDFYLNSNMPEGIVKLIGASQTQITAFQERLKAQILEDDAVTGFKRRIGYKLPVVNVEAGFEPFQFNSKDMQILEQQAWFTKIVWMAFGISEQDMGILENSNRSTSQTMFKQYARKAVRPILELIAERINQQIIPEFDPEGEVMFKWDDYDLDEDIKRHQLYQMQITMGIKTPEMVAEEEHIDLEKLQASKQRQQEEQAAQMAQQGGQPGADNFANQRGDGGKFGPGKQIPQAKSPTKPASYDRPNPDTKAIDQSKLGFDKEKQEHPEMSDDIIRQLVSDHLQEDPEYYSKDVTQKRQILSDVVVRETIQYV